MAARLGTLFKPFLGGVVGTGTLFLTQQVYEYKKFQEQMDSILPDTPPLPETPVVEADQKEWFVVGRQSPGYIRDPEKNPKHHLFDRITQSPLWLKSLGTHLDNESHYDLLPGSDFITVPINQDKKAPRVLIKPEKMKGAEIQHIPDEVELVVHIARKQAFAAETNRKSPFYHGSIALREVSKERPAAPGEVVITGKEAKQLLNKVNQDICEQQSCTMYGSNCYSALLDSTVELAELIKTRKGDDQKKKQDVLAIVEVTKEVAKDNFARGVANNPAVKEKLTKELPKIMDDLGISSADRLQSTSKPNI